MLPLGGGLAEHDGHYYDLQDRPASGKGWRAGSRRTSDTNPEAAGMAGDSWDVASGQVSASMLIVRVLRMASEPTPVMGRTECQELKVLTKITA